MTDGARRTRTEARAPRRAPLVPLPYATPRRGNAPGRYRPALRPSTGWRSEPLCRLAARACARDAGAAQLGIELEVNQRFPKGDSARWRAVLRLLLESFSQALGRR